MVIEAAEGNFRDGCQKQERQHGPQDASPQGDLGAFRWHAGSGVKWCVRILWGTNGGRGHQPGRGAVFSLSNGGDGGKNAAAGAELFGAGFSGGGGDWVIVECRPARGQQFLAVCEPYL